MELTETLNEGLTREYKVVIPATELETRLLERLQEIAQSVRLPGFRPGKVPMGILRKRYGDSVRGEILERTIADSWQKAVTDSGLRPAMEPKIEIVAFESGGDLEYKMRVEIVPDIVVADFSAMSLERLVPDVPEDEVDRAVERVAESVRPYGDAPEGHEATEGDRVRMDFTGSIDGEEFPGGAAEDFVLELGSGRFVPGFEDQMKGAKAGEARTVTVVFPEDYGAKDLAGKTADFAVTVKAIETPQEAVIDDEMAKKLGAEDLNDLRAKVRARVEQEYGQFSHNRLKRDLLDALADAHAFDLPPTMVEREFDTIWKQVEEAKERDELDDEDKPKSEDELKEQYKGIAARRVRLGLVLAEVGRANSLTVTQEEINRAIAERARYMPGQERQIYAFYQNNPQAMQELQGPLFEDKIINYILELAKVTERKVPVDELVNAGDSDDEKESATEAKAKSGTKAKPKAAPKRKAKSKATGTAGDEDEKGQDA